MTKEEFRLKKLAKEAGCTTITIGNVTFYVSVEKVEPNAFRKTDYLYSIESEGLYDLETLKIVFSHLRSRQTEDEREFDFSCRS